MTIDAPTLLEREGELKELSAALAEAEGARGQVVLIEAPAGLGKTSLVATACDAASKRGFTCLRARATELERDFAYGCVRQLLEHVVAKAEPESDRLFEGAAALCRPLLVPSAEVAALPSSDSSFAMLHGLYWLLSNLADQGPLALAVDDIHWSDAESLRFLNYLAPRPDGLPVVVLASARSGEDAGADLGRLAAVPESTVLRPKPLSVAATAALCEQWLGAGAAPEFATACRQATDGNPFFLEALLRELREQGMSPDADEAARVWGVGPAAVAEAVLLRLAERPAAATALVRAVAVIGDNASLAEAARLAELPEDEAANAADLRVTLAILKQDAQLEFAHPIVREAVYGDIGPLERSQAHARAAVILAEGGACEARIAAQIVEAEPTGDAERVELLRRVAADALVRGAPAAAAACLGRALAEPPPPATKAEVLLELGSAELRLAAPQAVEHLATAVDQIHEPRLLGTSVRQLANALTMSGAADRSVEAILSAIEIVEADDRERSLLLEAEAAAHAWQASLDKRPLVAAQLERHGDLGGDTPGERLVLANLAIERARASDSAREATEYLERALAGGRLLSDQQLDVEGTFYLMVHGLLATDALDLADGCLEQMLADARARASIPAQAFVIVHRGRVSMQRGAVADAEADARTALELLTAHDIQLGTTVALGVLIEAQVEAGEVEAGEQALTSSGLGKEVPPGLRFNTLMEARGFLRLAQGRTREGLDDLVEFGRRDELSGAANPLASRWRSRASLALAALGDAEAARRMAAEDLERARRWGAASGIGMALRASALVTADAVSVDGLRAAVGALEGSPARLEHARALTDLGAALRRANSRAEARSALQDGLDLAERCSARALVERARTELLAAGGRSSDPWGSGVEQLTASERRVAQLAAKGRSNPEIAQDLFVTRKTVETHLGRVYRKLDISGRGQLAQALDEQVPPAVA